MCPRIGSPASPRTGLRPLPGGGSASLCSGNSGVQQPAFDQTHAGEVVERRGEPALRLVEQVVRGADGRHSSTLLALQNRDWWPTVTASHPSGKLDACQVSVPAGVVQGLEAMTSRNPQPREPAVAAGATGSARRSCRRCATCSQEKPFAELSVSTISERAGVARSGFYFYFDSKYAVLAADPGRGRPRNSKSSRSTSRPASRASRRSSSPSGWSAAPPRCTRTTTR